MPKFLVFNANGLHGKADAIYDFAHTQDVDICFIMETWLSAEHSSVIYRPFMNLLGPQVTNENGGRRAQGGVLGFCRPEYNDAIREIYKHPQGHYAILAICGTIVAAGYFPPSMCDEEFLDFFDKAGEFCQEYTESILLVGDFNARLGRFLRDHQTNSRGRALLRKLEELPLHIIEPTQGRYTTMKNGGKGITDLVMTNDIPVANLIIHEDESLGGSDHRPLTFATPDPQDFQKKAFERWNVRKLAYLDVREQYLAALASTREQTRSELVRLSQDLAAPDLIPQERKQEVIDAMWTTIKDWYSGAAMASCGRFTFKSYVRRDFWTEALNEKKVECIIMNRELSALIDSRRPLGIRLAAQRRLTQANQEYREMLSARRSEIFENVVNDLSQPQNAGAFMRMVKGIQKRRTKTGCALDPSKINEHAQYYTNTFGGVPSGEENEYTGEKALPDDLEYQGDAFDTDQIQGQLRRLPLGKATGIDGLPAEFLVYGQYHTAKVLSVLFSSIELVCTVPSEWKKAMIVPIYKNKGSDKEIKYYRPIALTCICRRLYERLLLRSLDPFMDKLSDYQGGFRPHRSTLDQVFCLHEIMQGRPGMINVFLDLQTAYDRVDRRILWSKMYHRFNVPWSLIKRLQALFDHNSSILVVQGAKSDPIENLRGLLQGSSLSPVLFNFYINDLIEELSRNPDAPKITTAGIRTNALFFADDGNLHAMTWAGMIFLLAICEAWSLRNGMRFEPSKCVVIAKDFTAGLLKIYGEDLPLVESFPYLGVPFTFSGIDFAQNFDKRTTKAKGVVTMLARVGFNGTGWPTNSSIWVYKAFIRSVMEYGLCLDLLPVYQLKKLEQVQALAFRTLFSACRNTSINAMHKLLQVEPIATRNIDLNLRFMARLHNSTDASIPAVRLWWNILEQQPQSPSLVAAARKNPWRVGANLLNHLTNRPRRERCTPQVPLDDVTRKVKRRQVIRELDQGRTNVAGAIRCHEEDGKLLRHVLRPRAFANKQQRVTIIRWLLGGVVRHQPCKNCADHTPLSRSHALDCSGARAFLEDRFRQELEDLDPSLNDLNVLDKLLNTFRLEPPSETFYIDMHHAISLVYTRCLGFKQQQSGYWKRDDDDEDDDQDGPPAQRRRIMQAQAQQPNQQAQANAAARTRRRHQRQQVINAARNRPRGRPRRQPVQGVG
jgi:hypothetical protein